MNRFLTWVIAALIITVSLLAASAGVATTTTGPSVRPVEIVDIRFRLPTGDHGIINVDTTTGPVLTVNVNGRKVRVRIDAVERDIVRTDSWFQPTSL